MKGTAQTLFTAAITSFLLSLIIGGMLFLFVLSYGSGSILPVIIGIAIGFIISKVRYVSPRRVGMRYPYPKDLSKTEIKLKFFIQSHQNHRLSLFIMLSYALLITWIAKMVGDVYKEITLGDQMIIALFSLLQSTGIFYGAQWLNIYFILRNHPIDD